MDKVTIQTLVAKKADHRKIAMLAAYDYPFAKLAEAGKIDSILVGDSIGMTMFGFQSLLPVTMELMIPHTVAVRKGAPNVFLIGDLPFLTYEVTTPDAIRNAGRFMAECGCDAVKLEGGRNRADVVKALVNASIPVVGHIGFTPQAMTMLGGFQAPGQDVNAALSLLEDAKVLQDAGICMLVLEAVPADLAAIMTKTVIQHVLSRLHDIGVNPSTTSSECPETMRSRSTTRSVTTPTSVGLAANELNASYAADGHARIKGVGALCTTSFPAMTATRQDLYKKTVDSRPGFL